MDAAFDYCRKIVDDMEFNKKQFTRKLPVRLLRPYKLLLPNEPDIRDQFHEIRLDESHHRGRRRTPPSRWPALQYL